MNVSSDSRFETLSIWKSKEVKPISLDEYLPGCQFWEGAACADHLQMAISTLDKFSFNLILLLIGGKIETEFRNISLVELESRWLLFVWLLHWRVYKKIINISAKIHLFRNQMCPKTIFFISFPSVIHNCLFTDLLILIHFSISSILFSSEITLSKAIECVWILSDAYFL